MLFLEEEALGLACSLPLSVDGNLAMKTFSLWGICLFTSWVTVALFLSGCCWFPSSVKGGAVGSGPPNKGWSHLITSLITSPEEPLKQTRTVDWVCLHCNWHHDSSPSTWPAELYSHAGSSDMLKTLLAAVRCNHLQLSLSSAPRVECNKYFFVQGTQQQTLIYRIKVTICESFFDSFPFFCFF